MIRYQRDPALDAEAFIDLLRRSTLAERRPIDNRACIEAMLQGADLVLTAYDDDVLVGVARSLTDFHYCCYLSDLAVDRAYQRQGIGLALQRATQAALEPDCLLILLAAPAAVDYYPQFGYQRHPHCFTIRAHQALGRQSS
jgi:GNAT superfamily N-acetyltransferase